MKLYMTRDEIIATLFATAKIKHHFTADGKPPDLYLPKRFFQN